jgi:hypothetical protein
MKDLNSVLLEGVVQTIKPKQDHSGYWVEMKNRRDREKEEDTASHRFRIEVRENLHGCPPEAFTIGRRIRVVGQLRRESRLGSFIQAEHVEFRGEPTGAIL